MVAVAGSWWLRWGPPVQAQMGEGAHGGASGVQGAEVTLTFSQAPDQAVPGAASSRHPGQAQLALRGLRHLEAANGGHQCCLRYGAEEQG